MKAYFEPRDNELYIGALPRAEFPLHVHESVELVCPRTGQCTVQIDDDVWELQAGDLALIFPLVPHGYNHISSDADGMMSLFLPGTISEFARTFHQFTPQEPVIRAERLDPEVQEIIRRLIALPSDEPSPLRLAYLHLLLAHILQLMSLVPMDSVEQRDLALRVIRYAYDHACERITLDSTARDVGMSKSHLSHLFALQYRVNFRHFINGIRIHKALMLLRDPMATLTQVCYSCGYENTRTFRRAFVQETGMLPSDYLRSIRLPSRRGG